VGWSVILSVGSLGFSVGLSVGGLVGHVCRPDSRLVGLSMSRVGRTVKVTNLRIGSFG
jgi:hypothetical protein